MQLDFDCPVCGSRHVPETPIPEQYGGSVAAMWEAHLNWIMTKLVKEGTK